MGSQDNNLERTTLTLSNEIQRMRTEADWRILKVGFTLHTWLNFYASAPHFFLAGSNRFSSTSRVFVGEYSEYSDEIETIGLSLQLFLTRGEKKKVRVVIEK